MPVSQSSFIGTLIKSATGFESFLAKSADSDASPVSSAATNWIGNSAASAAAKKNAARLLPMSVPSVGG